MGFLSITRLSKDNSFPQKDLKKKLIEKQMGEMNGRSFIATEKAIDEGIAEKRHSDMGDYDYYVFETKYIKTILPKTPADPLLFSQKYSNAASNIQELYLKLVDKKAYFHAWKYEIDDAAMALEHIKDKVSRIDKKRIQFNIDYLNKSKRYLAKDDFELVF